jgi:hypothetical protein
VLHYLNNGGATLKFVLRKQEFLLPVVMVAKALMDISDQELFDRVVQGDVSNTFLTTRLELLLQDFKPYKLNTKSQCLAHMGSLFRVYLPVTEGTSDEDAGILLITRFFFVNAKQSHDKLEILLHMMRKLFSFAQGKCTQDNPDSLMNQELLLPGHLITMYLKEKMEELLMNVRQAILRDYRYNRVKFLNDCKGKHQNACLLTKATKQSSSSWSLHYRFAIAALSLCYRSAIALLSLCYRCATAALSLCYRCAFAVLSLRYRCAIAVLSLCYRCATAALSLCYRSAIALLTPSYRSAIAVLSQCYRSAIAVLSQCYRCAITALSRRYRFTIDA